MYRANSKADMQKVLGSGTNLQHKMSTFNVFDPLSNNERTANRSTLDRPRTGVHVHCYGSTLLSMYDDGFYDEHNAISVRDVAASEAAEKAVVFGDRNDRLLIENNPGAVSFRWSTKREPLSMLLASHASGPLAEFQREIWGFSTYKREDDIWRCEAWLHPAGRQNAEHICATLLHGFGIRRPTRIRDNNERYNATQTRQ